MKVLWSGERSGPRQEHVSLVTVRVFAPGPNSLNEFCNRQRRMTDSQLDVECHSLVRRRWDVRRCRGTHFRKMNCCRRRMQSLVAPSFRSTQGRTGSVCSNWWTPARALMGTTNATASLTIVMSAMSISRLLSEGLDKFRALSIPTPGSEMRNRDYTSRFVDGGDLSRSIVIENTSSP